MHTFIGIRPDPGPYGRTGVVMLSNSHNQIDEHALRILAEVGRMRSRLG